MVSLQMQSPVPVDRTPKIFFWVLLALLTSTLVWAAWSPLDQVVIAPGRVSPKGFVQSIQHLEGGIISKISVQEGQEVEEGELLAVLEQTATASDLAELDESIRALSLDRLRLQTELSDEPNPKLVIPNDPAYSATKRQETLQRFQARQEALRLAISVQEQEMQSQQKDLVNAREKLAGLDAQRQLIDEQTKIATQLRSEALSNRFEELDLLKELNAVDTQITEAKGQITRLEAALRIASDKGRQIIANFRDGASRELAEIQATLDRLMERRRKFSDNVARTTLRAPKSGVIRKIYINTVGGIVPAGGTLLDIVPKEQGVLIEARLQPRDVGLVRVGLEVKMTLTSADAARFGAIFGTVVVVSPDTIVDRPNDRPYYLVQIDTPSEAFISGNTSYPLVPGVELVVGIVVAQRSVLSYLMSPFMQAFDFSLSET